MVTARTISNKLATWGADNVALGGLGVLILLSVLAVGGVPLWAAVALGGFGAAAVIATHVASVDRRQFVAPVAGVLIALALYSTLQAIPLPIRWLERLSPHAADIWARCLLPTGEITSRGSISLDPGASFVEACKWASYACAFQLAATCARLGRGRRALRLVLVAAVTVALVTVAHQLLGAQSLFGLYTPRSDFKPHGIGPLLNPNHLAGYCNMGVLVGLGLMLDPNPRVPRWLIAAGTTVCLAVGLRTASRGGALALLAGVLFLGVLVVLQRYRRRSRESAPAGFGLAMVAGVLVTGVALAALGYDKVLADELTDRNSGKLTLAGWTPPLVTDFFPTGVGRGAFESVFTAYRPPIGTHQLFTHPENLVVQWAAEWGVVGLVALLALCWLLRPTRLALLRGPSYAGAGAAALAIVVHNLVDYSLELAGPASALALLLGVISESRHARRPSVRVRRAAPVLSLVTALLAIFAALYGPPSLADARLAVRDAVSARSEGASTLVRAMCRRYPADYYFPMMGGALAETRGENPIPWIQRAFERGPTVGRTHLLLAQVLGNRGLYSQGLLELKLALSMENGIHEAAAASAARWPVSPEAMLEIAPDGLYGAVTVDALVSALTARDRTNDAQALDRLALERFPESLSVRSRVVDRLLPGLGTPRCDATCEAELGDHASQLTARFPDSSAGETLRARISISRKETGAARDILRDACKKPASVLPCLRLLASVEEADRVGDVVSRYLALECVNRPRCATANDWAADTYAGHAQWAQAYGAAQHAMREDPNEARRARVATFGGKGGIPTDDPRLPR